MDMVRSMLKEIFFPNEYWAEAVNFATYVLNICPTKSVMNKVPEEAWSSIKQHVTHMRVFGCVAYAHILDQIRNKLDSKGEKCIFFGYSEESKAYRLYNPSTKKFVISIDVQFIEEEAWDGSIEKTMNVKSCLSHDEDEENVAENNTSLEPPPPPTQGQQGTPQVGVRTPLRSESSASPSTPHGAVLSGSSSTTTPNERGTRFRNLNEIYEKEAVNEGDRKSTRLNSSHLTASRMPSSA